MSSLCPKCGYGVTRGPGPSPRELEVAALVSEQLSNKEIGGKLGISPETVKNHIVSLFDKLEVDSRVGIAVWYIQTFSSSGRVQGNNNRNQAARGIISNTRARATKFKNKVKEG